MATGSRRFVQLAGRVLSARRLGDEPVGVGTLAGAQHQLVTCDQLTKRQRILSLQGHRVDGGLGAGQLPQYVVRRHPGEVVDEVPGKRRPVRVGGATAGEWLRCVRVDGGQVTLPEVYTAGSWAAAASLVTSRGVSGCDRPG